MTKKYSPGEIEAKWRKKWADSGAHSPDMNNPGNKLYSLTMFSYPSGDRLHIGHWYNYGPADTWTRFKKMQGYNTFHPQGFDAFGLPAENYAIKHGIHPAESTKQNIATMRTQLDRIGAMYDWSNYVDTSSPEYYKWTQWLFLKLFDIGLAVEEEAPVNWCNSCGTVLANEQVKEGLCERCGTVVVQKALRQWFFKITKYAEELLEGLDNIDWPERTKLMQRNWIGKSVGAEIVFDIADHTSESMPVFTTRPDTVFGATYMVLAPEHRLVDIITTTGQSDAVKTYQTQTAAQTELDRISQGTDKTGVFTGAFAVNPLNNTRIPIWIADYVLASYGTGAIMAVPGSDERDFEFAHKYGLEILEVVSPDGVEHGIDECFAGKGVAINSGEYSGLSTDKAFAAICDKLEQGNQGHRTTQFRLRDWCVSRQRYWGAPIPMIHCPDCGTVPVPEKDLPVELPLDIDLANSRGQDVSPLATQEDWVTVVCPDCGQQARRDTDTMDTFVDSAWYYLRYTDANYSAGPFNPERVHNWTPVDMYIGGADHATMHLLYARFFAKAMRDCGLVEFNEPFTTLRHQGVITADGAKMSKSKDNVVSPDSFVERFGSDVFRSYLMFMGPYHEGGDWNDSGINGLARFQEKAWKLLRKPTLDGPETDRSTLRLLHTTIRDVTNDLENMHFNTAISHMMELSNSLSGNDELHAEVRDNFILLIGPFMPHLAEELWELAGHSTSVYASKWPSFDDELCIADTITLGVTVNGKRRGEISVGLKATQSEVLSAARAEAAVAKHLEGGEVIKEIVVPGKLVNFVVK
ncbi:leucine--tRNA ligase [Candidatus Neomarinimicrobiota bacterium]